VAQNAIRHLRYTASRFVKERHASFGWAPNLRSRRQLVSPKPLTIGFVEPWDSCGPPDAGGSLGIWTWQVARRLARSHQVLVCSRRTPNTPAFEVKDGVHFFRFFMSPNGRVSALLQRLRSNQHLFAFLVSLYSCCYVIRTAIVLRRYRCEVIHVFNNSHYTPVIGLLNRRAKMVLNMHCDWLAGLEYSSVNRRLRYVHCIVGCSQGITDGIRRRFRHYAERCQTIYSGVDLELFHPAKRRLDTMTGAVLITVGRISPEKGLHVLLDALDEVLERRPDTKLRIIGPEWILPPEAIKETNSNSHIRVLLKVFNGNYLQQLQQRVSDSSRANVSFVGPLSHAEIAAELRKATILVQPSLYDLFPLPVLEAMATGLPVVASKVGGLPEAVLDGKTGLLVEPDDATSLARALIKLIDDRPEAQAMGIAGRARAVAMFSWEAAVRNLRSTYEFI
jgi:glycosyltransferase involved in cell wall biosynthesis